MNLTEENLNQLRLTRLRELREVVQRHVGQKGKEVKLNGEDKRWDMHVWACETSACALGSYAISEYGKRHWTLHEDGPGANRGTNYAPCLRARYTKTVTHARLGAHLDRSSRIRGAFDNIPNFGEDPEIQAARYFGITRREARYLFIPDDYLEEIKSREEDAPIPPSLVVKHIDKVIRAYEKGGCLLED